MSFPCSMVWLLKENKWGWASLLSLRWGWREASLEPQSCSWELQALLPFSPPAFSWAEGRE